MNTSLVQSPPGTSNANAKPGPNQPCWCGSARKYKKCHRDDDERLNRSHFTEGIVREEHSHPGGTLCQHYDPHSKNRPAVERPDFQMLVKRMRAEGKTLLHVMSPSDLGHDEAAFQKARLYLEENGIALSLPLDPPQEAIVAGQHFLDLICGAGAYRVLSTAVSFKRYGTDGFRRARDGIVEFLWGRDTPFGYVLLQARLDEWVRRGMTGPPKLTACGAAADLIRDLVENRQDIAKLVEALDDGRIREFFLQSTILTGIFDTLSDLPKGSMESKQPSLPLVATGLVFKAILDRNIASEVAAMALPDDAATLLIGSINAASRDRDTREVVGSVTGDWSSEAGFAELVRAFLKAFGDLQEERTPVGIHSDPQLKDKPDALALLKEFDVMASSSSESHPPGSDGSPSVPSLFRALDIAAAPHVERAASILQEVQSAVENQQQIDSQLKHCADEIARLKKERSDLDVEIKTLGDAAEAGLDQEIAARGRALLEVLANGSRELQRVSGKWDRAKNQRTLVEAKIKSSPDLWDKYKLLAEYEQMKASSLLNSLPPAARTTLEEAANTAQDAIGEADWQALRSSIEIEGSAVVPLPAAVAIEERRLRIGVCLPFSGANKGSLARGSLEIALATAVTRAMVQTVSEMGAALGSGDVTHEWRDQTSILWIEAPLNNGGSIIESLEDEGMLYQLRLEEALQRERDLGTAHLSLQVHVVSAELLEEVEEQLQNGRH